MLQTIQTTDKIDKLEGSKGISPSVGILTLVSGSEADMAVLSSSLETTSTSLLVCSRSVLEMARRSFQSGVDIKEMNPLSEAILGEFDEALTCDSQLTMLPSYDIKPTGKERGLYLIIDIGGSTLRVAVVHIEENSSKTRAELVHLVIEKKWIVRDDQKVIDFEFFKWISSKIKETLLEQTIIKCGKGTISAGISWSFPLDQTGHNSGRLVYVGKGYTIAPEVYKADLKEVLESALLENFSITIDVKAIINDSLAVYCTGAFMDNNTRFALVLGTGLNMCCSLKTNKMHVNKRLEAESVLLNMELSLFGSSLVPQLATNYDSAVDSRFGQLDPSRRFKSHMIVDPSTNEIFQPSELLTSGRYICEITRLTIVDMFEVGEIFANLSTATFSPLLQPYEGIGGKLLCAISETDNISEILLAWCKEYNWDTSLISEKEVIKLKLVVDLVIQRAAYAVATVLIGSLKLSHRYNGELPQPISIGCVGSVIFYFKTYRELILKYINENDFIKTIGLKVSFRCIYDCSLIGPAIAAAFYS